MASIVTFGSGGGGGGTVKYKPVVKFGTSEPLLPYSPGMVQSYINEAQNKNRQVSLQKAKQKRYLQPIERYYRNQQYLFDTLTSLAHSPNLMQFGTEIGVVDRRKQQYTGSDVFRAGQLPRKYSDLYGFSPLQSGITLNQGIPKLLPTIDFRPVAYSSAEQLPDLPTTTPEIQPVYSDWSGWYRGGGGGGGYNWKDYASWVNSLVNWRI